MNERQLKRRIDRRGKVITDAAKETSFVVKALQNVALSKAFDYIDRLTSDEKGSFKPGIENTNKAIESGSMFNRWMSSQIKNLVKIVIGKIKAVVSANDDFYEETLDPEEELPQTIRQKALDMVLKRLGYDLKSDEIVVGGWFEGLINDHGVGRKLGRDLANAVESETKLKDFKESFRNTFVSNGYLERYFNTFSNDFYMQIDRATAEIYRKELGYKHAIWSGTIMSESRPICIDHNNEAFTEDELLEIGKQDFKGKKPNHNIFLDLGGYNCRHILNWISEMMYMVIKNGQF